MCLDKFNYVQIEAEKEIGLTWYKLLLTWTGGQDDGGNMKTTLGSTWKVV